ncbi:MAG: hypothetical protein M5U07_22920 [Xanthobacteraceae bacterium]|nr:hypothetical protein [Xanthobacteraceae bacterium]
MRNHVVVQLALSTHLKDEALSPMGYMMERYRSLGRIEVTDRVQSIMAHLRLIRRKVVHDWLHHEFGLDKIGRVLAEPHKLDAEGFVTAVRAALPKARKLSAAEIARLKDEHAASLVPRQAAAQV